MLIPSDHRPAGAAPVLRARARTALNRGLRPLGLRIDRISSVPTPQHLCGLEQTLVALRACGLEAQRCVDVGAHKGKWTAAALKIWPDAEFLLVEPQKDLLQRAAARQVPTARLHLRAVGAGPADESRPFFHHQRSDSSSFAPSDPTRAIGEELLRVARIDTLIGEAFGGTTPEVVKLDCEGWDLEVIEGAGAHLGRITAIFIEAGVTNRSFPNTIVAAVDRFERSGYRLFDVGKGARNPRGALWNAELCFVLEASPVWRAASTWGQDGI